MRLIRLEIANYRVLHDLKIEFRKDIQKPEKNYTLTFLVGVNGSGKSTVFKALVEILSRLSRRQAVTFPFTLEYLLGNDTERHIVIARSAQDLEITIDGQKRDHLFDESLLPQRIVIFTTGDESEWEALLNTRASRAHKISSSISSKAEDLLKSLDLTSAELVIQELPGQPVVTEEQKQVDDQQTEGENYEDDTEAKFLEDRFLLIKTAQIPLLALCGLLADLASGAELLNDVLKEAQIKAFRGFSLKFRMNEGIIDPHDRAYIELLSTEATRALHLGSDYLLMFDLTWQEYLLTNRLLDLATKEDRNISSSARGLRFFERLTHLSNSNGNTLPILREINLFFERSTAEISNTRLKDSPILLFDWLSDGERSFLGRMCLFTLLGGTESFILLDEPEVHFNDFWKRQIVLLIDKVLQGHPSQALITTHSSITLTDAKNDDIVVLNREGPFTSEAFRPGIRTYAADPSDIIINIFGAPQAAGARSVESIREALRSLPEEYSELGRQRRIKQLESLIDQVGPGYWCYQLRRKLDLLKKANTPQ